MSASPLSPYWYRVATLKPALRPHIEIHPHRYRGVDWYLMSDPLSGRHHRFTPAAYQLIGLFDGQRTVDQIWEQVSDTLGDDAPTQQETIQLLTRLHAADALHSDITPDAAELFDRARQHRRARKLRQFGNPLAMRFPLLDPERFLERTSGLTRFLFTRTFAAAWLLAMLAAAVLTAQHWTDLTADLAGRVLAPANLALLWVLYPLVKLAHELGHAYATRRYGGEVHEIGIMLLVLMPVPYVDASSATAFVDKRHRMLVAAAGILVELALAALALAVWINVEPGMVRDAAFDVMLIGGVSTLLFNGNPLLKFDGYYVLADAIEMPNLAARANGYLGYLVERYVFAVPDTVSPAADPAERAWLVGYGVASFCYRLVISITIALFVAGKFFFIGVLLALWSMTMMLLWPLIKRLRYLASSPKLARRRPRAIAITAVTAALLAGLVGFVPVPSRTVAEGVIWLPPDARVRARAPAFIDQVLAQHRAPVSAGDALIASTDPLLAAEVERLAARRVEVQRRLAAVRASDRVQTQVLSEELGAVEQALAVERDKLAGLTIASPAAGELLLPGAADLPGRFVEQGEVLAYVIEDASAVTARIAVPQAEIALVRERLDAIEVRLASDIGTVLPATLKRSVPAATTRLPSAALGTRGGGRLRVAPDDEAGTEALDKVFLVDVELPVSAAQAPIGTRVYARFAHGAEPIAQQLFRDLRRLFLARFDV